MTIRVGFAGAGFIARYHAFQLGQASEPARIAVVHDPDRTRAAEFAAAEGAEVVDGLDELVDAVDAVFVCTWTSAHHEVVERCRRAGVAVFCEKPLAPTLPEAEALVDVLADDPTPHMSGLVLRSSPALLAMRELIRDERSGRVVNVVFRDDQFLPTQGMYASTWRAEVDKAGSGVLLEHSIHDLDLLEWLVGRIHSVTARMSRVHGIPGIEDSVSVLADFHDGATATLSTVWHDVLSRPSQRRIEVFCERALVTLEGDVFGPVRSQDSDDELVLEGEALIGWLAGRGVRLVSAEQEFLVAVREHRAGRTPPPLSPNLHDALRAHVLVDAVYRSARAGGSPVLVPAAAGPTG